MCVALQVLLRVDYVFLSVDAKMIVACLYFSRHGNNFSLQGLPEPAANLIVQFLDSPPELYLLHEGCVCKVFWFSLRAERRSETSQYTVVLEHGEES